MTPLWRGLWYGLVFSVFCWGVIFVIWASWWRLMR
jgi:hypothetical protein